MVEESSLEKAARHVAEAERIVRQQRVIISRLAAIGSDRTEAEELLKVFIRNLETFREDYEILRTAKPESPGVLI